MVEMALVFPLLVLLVLGVFEFGMAWKSSLSVSNALRSGTRSTANAGDERRADYSGLVAFDAAMANVAGASIERIVIFKADATGTVPASCLTTTAVNNGGVTGLCNTYTASDIASLSAASFTGGCTINVHPDARWCPTSRSASQANGLDYVGFYAEVRQDFQTGLFGSGITIKDTTVMRIEPQAV